MDKCNVCSEPVRLGSEFCEGHHWQEAGAHFPLPEKELGTMYFRAKCRCGWVSKGVYPTKAGALVMWENAHQSKVYEEYNE
jgi:hypothetical protein